MFNLIVAVISIALIAAMAAASIFYGGSAFGEGTAQAQASTLVNNGQQVSGAQQLYMIDNSGNRANNIDNLTPTYLQALPTAPDAVATGAWEIDETGQYAYIPLDDDATGQQQSAASTVCAELVAQGAAANITANITTDTDTNSIFDDVAAAVSGTAAIGDNQFACVSTGGDLDAGLGDTYFVFKL